MAKIKQDIRPQRDQAALSTDGFIPKVVVIGAGISGILVGIKLAEQGFQDYTIYEKSDGIGGTWHYNTYPGVACDVPSHLYVYSFEPNPYWTRHFADGADICKYYRRTADKYGGNATYPAEHGNPLSFMARRPVACAALDWRVDHGGYSDLRCRPLASSGTTQHPRARELRGRRVPQLALAARSVDKKQADRCHWHGFECHSDRGESSWERGKAVTVPANTAMGVEDPQRSTAALARTRDALCAFRCTVLLSPGRGAACRKNGCPKPWR